jgi:diaminohydroxyphosphoribosylaminopyrimidine deaminase/5-amino-6-(5-phosphoribosylamino)uracil reductase
VDVSAQDPNSGRLRIEEPPEDAVAIPRFDERPMARAFDLARRGLGLASPNPMVGAVVVAPDGRILGEGWHEGPGTPHAEIAALASLRAAGHRAAGATMYVTLEPCNHHGRTPPCAPVLASSGLSMVIASVADPNPHVTGGGFEVLREAGVAVLVGVRRDEGHRLIEAFAKSVTTGMPFVTLKLAMSLDGKIAARDGTSRWISGEEARRDVHVLRAGHDAVMVGAGTAIADDPSLTVRLAGYMGRQPVRIVVDASGRTPPSGRLFDGSAPIWLVTTSAAPAAVRSAWEAGGARVITRDGHAVAIRPFLAGLGEEDRPLRSVLIEGGPTLAWSAVREGVVDRFVFYVAPKLIGGTGAPGAIGGDGIASIEEALSLQIESVERVGEDVKVSARPAGAG